MSKLDMYIKKLAKRIKRYPKSILTWFDDAGGIKIDEKYFLIKVDGFATSKAKYPWCSYRDFGFKAVTAAVSDVFSKGCRPIVYAVSIGLTPNDVDFLDEIVGGLEDATNFYGGYIENMDTNMGMDTWIDVFVVAECRYLPVPRRARPGDIVVTIRGVGLSSIAYREYTEGREPIDQEVLEFSCRPIADPRVVDAIERLRICAIGSIDISDTIYETLEHLMYLNNVGMYIDADETSLLHPKALTYAYLHGINYRDMFLGSSEEFTPILIIDKTYLDYVIDNLRAMGFTPNIVGVVISSIGEITWRGAKTDKYLWDYEIGKIRKTQCNL